MTKGKLIETYEEGDEKYGNDTLYDQNFMDLLLEAKKEFPWIWKPQPFDEEFNRKLFNYADAISIWAWFQKWLGDKE